MARMIAFWYIAAWLCVAVIMGLLVWSLDIILGRPEDNIELGENDEEISD